MSAKPIVILSLGAGVQSTALLLMSIRGELPKIDHCVFSDTQYEPPAVYAHLEWLKGEAARAGVPVHVVTRGNLRQDAIDFRRWRKSADGKRFASVPLFVLNADGSRGLINRQCTSEYKIEPIERFIRRDLLGLRPGQRAPREAVVDQWFGITYDEIQRMRRSPEKWKRNVYPFCGKFCFPDSYQTLLPRPWKRADCVAWLRRHYPDRTVPRSACICCPYRSDAEWRDMRQADPASFADAVRFDAEIRDADAAGQASRGRVSGLPYVHRSLEPLAVVDLDAGDDTGQALMGFANECEGMCGV